MCWAHWVVGAGNALPREVVEEDTTMGFKRLFDRHTKTQEIERQGSCADSKGLFNMASCSTETGQKSLFLCCTVLRLRNAMTKIFMIRKSIFPLESKTRTIPAN